MESNIPQLFSHWNKETQNTETRKIKNPSGAFVSLHNHPPKCRKLHADPPITPAPEALQVSNNNVKHRAEAREKKNWLAPPKVAAPSVLPIPVLLPVGLNPNTDAGVPGVVMPVPVPVVGVVPVVEFVVVEPVPAWLNKTEQNHVNCRVHSNLEVHGKYIQTNPLQTFNRK